MQRILPFALLSLMLTGCDQAAGPTAVVEPEAMFSSAPTRTADKFFATAMCAADIGFNIYFGGDRVLMTHTSTDRKGKTHTTIHFQAHEFRGWRLPETVFTDATVDYQVQGGAEMFAIQRDASGNITVRIHQGNLVFVDMTTGQRVIAHHTIRQVPGQQETQNFWNCRMVG